MNYLNPHTHDLSGDQPKGLWIARPECVTTHNPYANGKEIVDQGWRDRGEGYDHEHFDRIRIEPADDTDDQPFGGEPAPAPIILPTYTAGLTVRDRQGNQVLEFTVTGSAHVVAAMITWAGDSFKEDQER